MKKKFAVVGCGSIGRRHAAVLDAEPHAELVALCDKDIDKARHLSDLYGGVPCFTDYAEMLNSVQADVINVVTPHALHASMAIEALRKNFHVLVEKPMALTSAECRQMIEAADRSGRKLWVVKQNRFNVPVKLAHEAVREGWLGKIFMVKCDVLWNRYQGYYDESPWRGKLQQEGGALFTQASHFIDLLIWWCGDIVEAKAYAETQNHRIETEDSGIALLRFESGTMGSLVWTTCVHNRNFEGSITLIGEKGTIKIGGEYLNRMEFWDVDGHPLPEGIDFNDKPNSYGKYQGTSSNHHQVISSIIAFLEGRPSGTVEGWEGLRSVEAIEKIYKSIRG